MQDLENEVRQGKKLRIQSSTVAIWGELNFFYN